MEQVSKIQPPTPDESAPPVPASSSSSKPTVLVKISVGILTAAVLAGFVYAYYSYTASRNAPISPSPTTSIPSSQEGIGRIVFGTDATFPPMEYLDEQGQLTGYDIELGQQIAQELGISAEFKNIEWDRLFEDLLIYEIDAILSSVTINSERELQYDFSSPYINAGQVIITQRVDTTIRTAADLAGKRIAVQGGTTNETTALEHTSDELVQRYADFDLAAQTLVAGQADAVISDLTNAKGLIDSYPELKIASDPITSDYYGIVFRPGESDLIESVNTALESLRQRGVLTQLQQKWLE